MKTDQPDMNDPFVRKIRDEIDRSHYKRQLKMRIKLLKLIPRMRLNSLMDNDKRPYMMERDFLISSLAELWDEEINDAVFEYINEQLK